MISFFRVIFDRLKLRMFVLWLISLPMRAFRDLRTYLFPQIQGRKSNLISLTMDVPKKELENGRDPINQAVVDGNNEGIARSERSAPGKGPQSTRRESIQQNTNAVETKVRDSITDDRISNAKVVDARADAAGERKNQRHPKKITPVTEAMVDDALVVKKIATNVVDMLQTAEALRKTRLVLQHDTNCLNQTISENKTELAKRGELEQRKKQLRQTRMSGKQAARKESQCWDVVTELMERIGPPSTAEKLKDEDQLHAIIQRFVTADRKTERLLVQDCPCYLRLKLLIQGGGNEITKSRSIRPYFEVEPNEPSTRVDMPQIMIAAEMASFVENCADSSPSSSPSSSLSIPDWETIEHTSWGRQQNKPPPFKPLNKIETNSQTSSSSSPKVHDSRALQTASSERQGSLSDGAIMKALQNDHTFEQLARCMLRKMKLAPICTKLSAPDLVTISCTPYLWTIFSILYAAKSDNKEALKSAKLDSKQDESSSTREASQIKACEVHPRDTKMETSLVILRAGTSSGALSSTPPKGSILGKQCMYHPLNAGKRNPDQLQCMISYVIRLMKRRRHCLVKITDLTDSDLCIVCLRPLCAANTDSSLHCIACHIKIHRNCDADLYELCAPMPRLSKQDLERNREALDDYVNPEFKPEIPALIVHIAFLILFGDCRVKGLYRNPETDSELDAFKKLLHEGRSPNLLNLEPSLLGELLKYFLGSLKPRLITKTLFKKMKATKALLRGTMESIPNDVNLCRSMLAESSSSTRETLVFLFMHLQEVHIMKEVEITIMELGRAFTPVLIDGFEKEQNLSRRPVIERMLRLPREVWQFLFSEYVEGLQ